MWSMEGVIAAWAEAVIVLIIVSCALSRVIIWPDQHVQTSNSLNNREQ
jgi:hypothetical protein